MLAETSVKLWISFQYSIYTSEGWESPDSKLLWKHWSLGNPSAYSSPQMVKQLGAEAVLSCTNKPALSSGSVWGTKVPGWAELWAHPPPAGRCSKKSVCCTRNSWKNLEFLAWGGLGKPDNTFKYLRGCFFYNQETFSEHLSCERNCIVSSERLRNEKGCSPISRDLWIDGGCLPQRQLI